MGKKIGILKLKFRGLRILWTSDQDLFSQNLDEFTFIFIF